MLNGKATARLSRWLRWTHEYVFSLNLAWTIVWIERVKTKVLGGRVIGDYISALVGGAYQLVSPIGGRTILDQLIWSLSSTVPDALSPKVRSASP